MLSTQYGGFIEGGAAFEITDPDTPSPWTNVVSNGRYGFVVSQNGGGFAWLDHCQLNVLTRWEMDLVRDDRGRFLYLADLDAGEDDAGGVWSLSPQPCRARYDRFRCVHRRGRTVFETSRRGIDATWELAAAAEDTAEVWRVSITNTEGGPRRLRLAAFFEWCCGTAPDVKREFHRLFFTTIHDDTRRMITATKNMWDAPFGTRDDHWNRPWPHAAALAIAGVDNHWATSDKADFLGRYGSAARPAGLLGGVKGRFGRFVDASAVLGTDLELGPGETREIHYVLAVADDPAGVASLVDRLSDRAAADAAVEAASASWDLLLEPFRVRSESEAFDVMTNHWLPYQAISARMWGRTGYYQQSGAFGYRDQLQDSQLWLMLDPARCREQILLHAAHQFADGSVYHWWNPITETGKHDRCSDDYLWLPFVTAAYVRETGDVSILDERVRFVHDEGGATIAEHGDRAIRRALSRMSERGLPLIGDNDWNDGLSHVGTETAGESVWLAFFLHSVLEEFGRAMRLYGEVSRAEGYDRARSALRSAVNEHAWDGEWFRRATDADGRWLGSQNSVEGRIFLNPQTWAILADATTQDRADAAWEAVKARLFMDYGALLLAPAYTVPDAKIGYLSRYAPGARENGGVYMHAATWALAAACKRRDRDAGERLWRAIMPPIRGADPEAYVAEPYVMPGNVDGPLSETPGRAGWTWYTGSAAWMHRVHVEWLLGLRATWEGLAIDPCPVGELGVVEAERRWRGRTIRVRFDSSGFDPDREAVIEVDGRRVEGCVIDESMVAPGGVVEVRVSWPEPGAGVAEVMVRSGERSKA